MKIYRSDLKKVVYSLLDAWIQFIIQICTPMPNIFSFGWGAYKTLKYGLPTYLALHAQLKDRNEIIFHTLRPLVARLYLSVKLMFSVAIYISYSIQLYVAVKIIWPKMRKYFKSKSTHKNGEYFFRIGLVILTCKFPSTMAASKNFNFSENAAEAAIKG